MNNGLYIVGPEPIKIGDHIVPAGNAIGVDVDYSNPYGGGKRKFQKVYAYDKTGDVDIIAIKDPVYGNNLVDKIEFLENNGKILQINDIDKGVPVDSFMEKNKDTIDEMCVFSKDLSWDELRTFMNDRDNRYNSEYIKRMEINEDIHLYTGVRNRKIYKFGGGHDEELDDLENNDATLCPYTGARQFHINEQAEAIQIERIEELEAEKEKEKKEEKEIQKRLRLEERVRTERAHGMRPSFF